MKIALFASLLAIAGPSAATGLRELCPDNPGKATPPCIVDVGHIQVETALVDWSRDRRPGLATDNIAFATSEIRYGLTRTLEVEVTIAPFDTSTTHDRTTGTRTHLSGFGDMRLGLRQSLMNPDGKGVSLAAAPFVILPTGKNGIGTGGWSAGLLLPLAAELPGGFGFAATPEIDWSVDASGGGHHATYTGVVALTHAVGAVQAGAELWASRDDDPAVAVTQASIDLTLAWIPEASPNLQFDAGFNAGLNNDTPATQVYIGITRRF